MCGYFGGFLVFMFSINRGLFEEFMSPLKFNSGVVGSRFIAISVAHHEAVFKIYSQILSSRMNHTGVGLGPRMLGVRTVWGEKHFIENPTELVIEVFERIPALGMRHVSKTYAALVRYSDNLVALVFVLPQLVVATFHNLLVIRMIRTRLAAFGHANSAVKIYEDRLIFCRHLNIPVHGWYKPNVYGRIIAHNHYTIK